MDHPRSKLPAVLAILFCIALLGGVGVLLWKTLPEKQQPQQAETIQTDSVFSSEQTAVEPEREAPYEGELPEQAEAAQPEQPDSEQPSEPAADPAAPDDTPVTDAQKTAQATLASMTEDEKLWQLFFVTPEAITNVNTATVAGEATKNALAQYPVGGIVYFAKNLEDRAQAAALLANTQSYAKIPLFLGVDEEGGTVSRIGANEALGGTKVADMRSFGQSADPAQVYAAGQTLAANLTGLGFNLDFAPDCDVVSGVDSVIGSRSFGSDPELCASLAGVIDADTGEEVLFGDDFTVDDIIWTGPQPTLREEGARAGVADCRPLAALADYLAAAIRLGRRIHYLPPYRGETKLQLSALLGIAPALLHDYKSVDLMFAVAEMREVKSAEEVAQMEDAFHIGYAMHTTAMRMCRAGVVEREIAGAIEGVAKSMGLGVSFPSIVSQHGETLHNLNSEGVLADGRLLLVDAGGENRMNYCSDHTRTYPVSGRFTAQQREIYDIVLACHDHIARIVRPGMMYMQEVHLEAYRKLAEGLVGVGLLKGSADDAVAAGAMYLFMPHGLGHGLGMDVHDCENIGERSFDYSLVAERAAQSATCLHRATWRLRPGTILSDEPGIYFIPALVDKCEAEGKFRGIVDYDLLRSRYLDFGGIRIEDDLLVTDTGCRILGDRTIPVTVEELEAVVGR